MAKGFTAADVPDFSGKCFMVTGANTGLGFEVCRVIAARGGRVLMACRNADKAHAAMARIREETPAADLALLPLDQADLDSVRACADLARQEPRIDVLLNNAGVMFPPLGRTKQGHELQWGVNHLAAFALTGLMLPKLAETAGSRVVTTSSLAHRSGRFDWADLDAHKGYNKIRRYSASKLANLLHVFELDRRLRAAGLPVTAVCCHPGVASTELSRHSRLFGVFFPLAGKVFNTPATGAWPSLQAATARDVVPGGYYGPQRFGGLAGPSGLATRASSGRDPALAKRLWDVSVEMTGIDPGLPPL